MSRHDHGGWPAYVPVAKRRRQAEREAARLRKKGQTLAPVRVEGRAIAGTPWGKAWCDNLERYRDYESRLPRGRTYVRNGSVGAKASIAVTGSDGHVLVPNCLARHFDQSGCSSVSQDGASDDGFATQGQDRSGDGQQQGYR